MTEALDAIRNLVASKATEWNADLLTCMDYATDDTVLSARIGMGFNSAYKHIRIYRASLQTLSTDKLMDLVSISLSNLRSVDLAKADDGGSFTDEKLCAYRDSLMPLIESKFPEESQEKTGLSCDIQVDFLDRVLRVKAWNENRRFGRGFVLRPKDQDAFVKEFNDLLEVLINELR